MQGRECEALARAMAALPAPEKGRVWRVMEVCGSHTMSIAQNGIRTLLPPHVELLSGPGCPVCVSAAADIDACIGLAGRSGVLLCSYGDMLRVPGSKRGMSLLAAKAQGARVEMLYSPMDALSLARKNPADAVVFLGVGFETTAPGTAALLRAARAEGLRNLFLYPLLKRVEPAIRALAAAPDFAVDAFLCPGHVASVTGAASFAFIAEELKRPAAVAGFEASDILRALYALLKQLAGGEAKLENLYSRVVRPAGNALALAAIGEVFVPCGTRWRGLGPIENSGFGLREAYAAFDARAHFGLGEAAEDPPTACRCGEILRGAMRPWDCPCFGKSCTPQAPLGPCMVSGEGACAAAWQYGEWDNERET